MEFSLTTFCTVVCGGDEFFATTTGIDDALEAALPIDDAFEAALPIVEFETALPIDTKRE